MSATNSTATPDPARRYESRASEMTLVLILCPAVAAIFTAMRIFTRITLIKKHFPEDLSILLALACTITMSVIMKITIGYGNGRHIETVSRADLTELLKLGIGTNQTYSLAHCFLKLSILLQYLRITVMPSERRLCYVLIAISTTGYLAFFVVRWLRCIPFEAQWVPNIPGAKCINNTVFIFASQAWNMVMDFVILLVPIYILRHLNVPWRHRLLLGVVLAFGGSACIISAIRLQTLYPSTTSADPTWDKIPSAFYGQIEVNVGIVCACVVTLRPLYHRLRRPFSKDDSERKGVLGRNARCNFSDVIPTSEISTWS